MVIRRQLTEQIRFSLDQLRSQNQHHDFEHIARHIARNRIAANILPATGPVAGRGDQGRDAETFRTYLSVGTRSSSETAIGSSRRRGLGGPSIVGSGVCDRSRTACTVSPARVPWHGPLGTGACPTARWATVLLDRAARGCSVGSSLSS